MSANHIASTSPYEFAPPEIHLAFPVSWPNKEGRITVTHHLRPPTFAQMAEFKRKTTIERETDHQGAVVSERADIVAASQWLWDQIIIGFDGYPGLDGFTEATPENKAKMRSTHKEAAIEYLLSADAEVLLDESAATFDGGEWAVALKIGPDPNEPTHTVVFRFREWTERERRDFERSGSVMRSRTEGKNTITRYSINLAAFYDLFVALLLDAQGGVVEGKTFAELGREAFARHVNGEFIVTVITTLTRFWKRKASD